MSDFNYSKNYGNYSTVDVVAAQNTLLRKVYLWMTAALAITGFTAFTVASNPALLQMIANWCSWCGSRPPFSVCPS